MANYTVALEFRRNTRSQGITDHRFPSDPELRKLWIVRCKKADNFNIENSRICALYFTPDVRDLKAELLGSTSKRVLKVNAVPTLHLTSSSRENNPPICYTSKTEVNLKRTISNTNYSSKFMLKRDRANRCQARENKETSVGKFSFPKKEKAIS
ncbi:uncharacterized protein LOC118197092 [Stegodyphus dumicola]|uniref:uncharacterized protein LOC118197092 n=1 Tax=Stegodyphus dumicola TaxID=202533 RepID=UPI0015A9458C|nr:uncharacterized protein LOC118197092 [Stegodyphus dumicola]